MRRFSYWKIVMGVYQKRLLIGASLALTGVIVVLLATAVAVCGGNPDISLVSVGGASLLLLNGMFMHAYYGSKIRRGRQAI